MLPLRSNYHNMYKDEFCPLCVIIRQEYFIDNQEHLLNWKVVNKTAEVTEIEVDYNDIFSENISKQEKITIILENKFNKREKNWNWPKNKLKSQHRMNKMFVTRWTMDSFCQPCVLLYWIVINIHCIIVLLDIGFNNNKRSRPALRVMANQHWRTF